MNPYARHANDTAELNPIDATKAGHPTPAPDTTAESGPDSAHDVDLSQDPFADDLSERLEAVAPRRWISRTTVSLAGLVLLVAGFVGGAQVEKHWGTPNGATGRPAAFPSGNPFAAGGFGGRLGGRAGGGQGGNATTGTVKLVDGDTVYITTSQGQTVIVNTTGSTAVNVTRAGSLKDLAPGTAVTIQGQTGSDGAISATSITKSK